MKGLPLAIILSLVLWTGIVYAIKAVAAEKAVVVQPQQTPVEDAEPECDQEYIMELFFLGVSSGLLLSVAIDIIVWPKPKFD